MAGYSGRPLYKKLGIKEGYKIALINPPSNYQELLGPFPFAIQILDPGNAGLDMIHLFVKNQAELIKHFETVQNAIHKSGMIWISWYKKSSKIPTDITEDTLRELILPTNLVDVKVCAVDEKWSALKFVWRKEAR